MKGKHFKLMAAFLGLIVGVFLNADLFGAQYGSATAPQRPPTPTQNEPAPKEPEKPKKVNKAEEAAYKAFYNAQGGDPAQQIQLGEDFIAKFPNSMYLGGVYGALTAAYFQTGATSKMFAAGDKALQLDPDNVDVLALLAMAIPRVKANAPDATAEMQKAETYAHHAIELIPNMTKPAAVEDATFEKAKNDKLALAHSGLGLIDIHHQKYDDAKAELEQAVKLASKPDTVDYYLLGNADVQGSYYHAAIAAYEQCATSGTMANITNQCKSREESAKKDLASGTKLSRD